MVLEKGIRLVVGIYVIALIARYMGPSVFGQLNFALATLSVLVVIVNVGLNRIVIRETTAAINDNEMRAEVVATAFFLRLLASLIIMAIVGLGVVFYAENGSLLLLVLASITLIPFDVVDLHQQGVAKIRGVSIIRTTVFMISAGMKIGIVYLNGSIAWIFALVFVEYFLLALGFLYLTNKINGMSFLSFTKFSRYRAVSFLKESWPELIAGFSGVLFVRLDQIMLQLMQGEESVGIYSAAVRISEAWYFFPTAIISVTFPKIVQMKHESESKFLKGLQFLYSTIVAFTVFVCLGMILFSSFVIDLLYGVEYSQSAIILRFHCLIAIFIFLGSASGSWLAAEKKLIWNLHRNLFGLIVNIIANVILIPSYGPIGAAWATLIAVIAAFYLFDMFTPKLRLMFIMKSKALFTLGMNSLFLIPKKVGENEKYSDL